MSEITKETIEDKIEVIGEYKCVQVRTATVIKEDGVELTRSFHRHAINPGEDISGQSQEVQGICNSVHTPEVVDAYNEWLESTKPSDSEESTDSDSD
jgi:hypothetical protein|tara:strand:+ start:145 stop:435 length:291 start_codon:yes stop_codon:yes gene_type:complete